MKTKKLLLIGGTNGSIHIKNYFNLISSYFEDVLIISQDKIDFHNHKTINFSIKNPFIFLWNVFKMKQIINKYKPSVIHVHQANSFSFLTTLANRRQNPLIITTWGSDVLLLPEKGRIYKYIVKYSLNRADFITADAAFMKEKIIKMGIKNNIMLANFGIDFESIPDSSIKKNIIYSNRLHEKLYNVDKIIISFSHFIKDNSSWKLIIGANGSETENLLKLAEKILPKNSFEFIGFVNRKENIQNYLKSKIWVSIPSSDGTAISLLEAMAYGCIPILSDLPANREWVKNNENGIIVEDKLENEFNNALNLELEHVKKRNLDLISKHATKKANRDKFLSIYNKVDYKKRD